MIGIIKTIKNGEYELLDSGVIQVLESESTTILFDTSSIIFSFERNETSEPLIKVDSSQTNSIKFVLVNMGLPSYGTTDFIKFGKLADEKDIYISFKINSLNDKKVRSLEYSIYKK